MKINIERNPRLLLVYGLGTVLAAALWLILGARESATGSEAVLAFPIVVALFCFLFSPDDYAKSAGLRK